MGKTLSYLLTAVVALMATGAWAADEVVNLGGEKISIDADGFSDYKDKIIQNGTITLSNNPQSASVGKYTIGSGAVVNFAGGPGFDGDWDWNIVDGGIVNQTKESEARMFLPFYYGNCKFTLDNGTFTSQDPGGNSNYGETLNIGVLWNNNDAVSGKNTSVAAVVKNGSTISLPNGALRISGGRKGSSKKAKTVKVDFAVTDSIIEVKKAIIIGSDLATGYWISDTANSYVRVVFGPGSDLRCDQIYCYKSFVPEVTFDGATVRRAGDGKTFNFIGQNPGLSGDVYTIAAGGLTIDVPSDRSFEAGPNMSVLKGEGGLTKIGGGSITVNQIVSSSTAKAMTFTGPLVVSNGTWSSSLSYAASAFAVDGANSTLALSGALTAAAPDMSVTQGGTLNLQSSAARKFNLGTLTLGEGATLAVTGNGLGVDEFSSAALVLSATAANKVALAFSDAADILGGTYRIITITGGGSFAPGDEAKFKLDAKAPEGSSLSVSGASLILTVPSKNPATWTGGANDGKFSSAGNWLGNKVPGAEDEVVINVDSEETLECDVALNVKSITFNPSSAKVSINGTGSIVIAESVSNGSDMRHVIGVPVEFKSADVYAPIDVTGEVDFQGGVTGTVPENHTTFYGDYTLKATSWTVSSAITLAENANVAASELTLTLNGNKLLAAKDGSIFSLKQITYTKQGDMFGEYKGELFVETLYLMTTNIDKSSTVNNAFKGVLHVGAIRAYVKSDYWYWTPEGVVIVGGQGFSSAGGGFYFGKSGENLLLRSSADWGIINDYQNTLHNGYFNFGFPIDARSLDIDTSNYEDRQQGHTVTVSLGKTKDSQTDRTLLDGKNGPAAVSAFGAGTFFIKDTCFFTGGFTASNGVTVAVNKNAYPGKGNVTIKDTATLKLAQSSSGTVPVAGTLTMEGGSRLLIPALARDVVPLSAAAVVFDGISADKKVALEIQNADQIGEGIYPILSSASEISDSALDAFAQEQELEGCALRLSSDRRMIMLVCGSVNYWVGDVSTDLTDAGNWLNGVPGEGESATIACGAETTLTIPEGKTFSPSSIVFSGGAPVTIEGPGIISGIVAVTNSSLVSHTINAPVHFAGDIAVAQNARGYATRNESHITFAGGAYAAEGCSIAPWHDGYSYAVFGRYVLANTEESPYAITEYKVSSTDDIRFYVAPGSALEVPYAGAFTELDLAEGGVVTNRVVSMPEGQRLSHKNYGEYVIADEFTVSGSNKKDGYAGYNAGTGAANVFKIEKATCNKTDGYTFYFAEHGGASCGTYYFGKGGINFGDGKGYFGIGKNADGDAQMIRPWYSDFIIGTGAGNTDGFDMWMFRSITFNTDDENGVGRKITLNARPRFNNTPSFTVAGSGTVLVNSVASNNAQPPVTVTDTATLAFKPGASLTTDNITVNSGATLAVAGSGTFALGGGLTLADGACLGFNYSTRNAPVLDLADKNVTLGDNKNIVVKITSENGKRAFAGKNVLTSGRKFAGVTVTLAPGAPDWVKGIDVVDDEIVLDVKPMGTRIIVR